MPIWEYRCNNCGTLIEKITLSAKVAVPQEIVHQCKKCQGLTRHVRNVPKPAIMSVRKPGQPRPDAKMKDIRPAKDKHWKQRVKEGLAPDGKTKLSDLKAESLNHWAETTAKAVGGDAVLQDAAKEAKERAEKMGFKYESSVASIREAALRGDPIPANIGQPHLAKRNNVGNGEY